MRKVLGIFLDVYGHNHISISLGDSLLRCSQRPNCPYSSIKNNIVYDQAGDSIWLEGATYAGLDIGKNCTYNSDGNTPKASTGASQPTDLWSVNPRFVAALNNDFHLLSNSPCINAGASIPNNAVDYENNFRPIGSGWHIGAAVGRAKEMVGERRALAMVTEIPQAILDNQEIPEYGDAVNPEIKGKWRIRLNLKAFPALTADKQE